MSWTLWYVVGELDLLICGESACFQGQDRKHLASLELSLLSDQTSCALEACSSTQPCKQIESQQLGTGSRPLPLSQFDSSWLETERPHGVPCALKKAPHSSRDTGGGLASPFTLVTFSKPAASSSSKGPRHVRASVDCGDCPCPALPAPADRMCQRPGVLAAAGSSFASLTCDLCAPCCAQA